MEEICPRCITSEVDGYQAFRCFGNTSGKEPAAEPIKKGKSVVLAERGRFDKNCSGCGIRINQETLLITRPVIGMDNTAHIFWQRHLADKGI